MSGYYHSVSENMKSSSSGERVEYSITRSALNLISYYLIVKLPRVEVKENYKKYIKLMWNVPALKERFCKNTEVYIAGKFTEIVNWEYMTMLNNFVNLPSYRTIEYVDSKDEFHFHVKPYSPFVEKFIDTREKLSTDDPLVEEIKKYEKENKSSIIFSCSFDDDITKFLIVTSVSKNPEYKIGNYGFVKEIIENKIEVDKPVMIGYYGIPS